MILELLIFILTTIVVYYLYLYKRNHNYFKNRDIKFLPGWPIFGNVFGSTFLKNHFLEELAEVYNAFPDEGYVGFTELTSPIILVQDPEIIKNVLVKDFDHFVDHRVFFTPELDKIIYDSLFLMKGDRWRDMRNTLSPSFTGFKMKFMLPFMMKITNNILEYLNDHQNQDIDVDDLMRRYTNDVIASAGFGLEVNSLKDRDNEFYSIGGSILNFNYRQRVLMFLVSQFPSLGKIPGCRLFSEKVCKFFSNIVASTMEYRKQYNVERPDMIQLLMETKKDFTPQELSSQVFLFFIAGYETSASALVMTIHELALNSHVQDKLYDEIKNCKDEVLTFDKLNEMKYLEAVVNETLRKWTPAAVLDRACTKSYELPPPREGGKPSVIEPGDVICVTVSQVHMDPKHWPEPHKYDPERFLDENKQKIKSFTFMPFGIGPRACIGTRFAMMEVKVLLYYLIVNYKIVKTARTDLIKVKPHNFNLRAMNGTHVRFERRLSE